jgi:chemotaxis protein MotB
VGGEAMKNTERQKFEKLKKVIEKKIEESKELRRLKKHVKFTETREGLRIDLVDEADFAMFAMGTDRLLPEARELLSRVAQVIAGVPNDVIVRGHTDGLPYASGRDMNNWRLSSGRAEATRTVLSQNGIRNDRFMRIEGVADREPFIPGDRYDPRNRRMSVILAWSRNVDEKVNEADTGEDLTARRVMLRDERKALAETTATKLDLGRTALPAGAAVTNSGAMPKKGSAIPPGKSEATAARSKEKPAH